LGVGFYGKNSCCESLYHCAKFQENLFFDFAMLCMIFGKITLREIQFTQKNSNARRSS
jgi:hypothetical protein